MIAVRFVERKKKLWEQQQQSHFDCVCLDGTWYWENYMWDGRYKVEDSMYYVWNSFEITRESQQKA